MNIDITVLVVDDSSTMRKIISSVLEKMGVQKIVEAGDGISALEVLKSQEIDLILSDWVMPRMTGHELLLAVKNDKGLKHIPFIMITAEGLRESILTAVRDGAALYICKPFEREELQSRIETVMQKQLGSLSLAS